MSVPVVSSGSSGLEQGSMELVLDGCTGDVWEVLVLRRRTRGPYLPLLLLCWLLAAHSTAHGEWGKKNMRGFASILVCVCKCVRLCVSLLVAQVAADQTRIATFVASPLLAAI